VEKGDIALSSVNSIRAFEENFLAVDEDRAEVDAEALRFSK
jgi:hypothetical protein